MNKLFGSVAASLKTTALGVMALLTVVGTVGSALLDGDPATNPDWNAAATEVMLAIALIFSRDADVTSEKAKLK